MQLKKLQAPQETHQEKQSGGRQRHPAPGLNPLLRAARRWGLCVCLLLMLYVMRGTNIQRQQAQDNAVDKPALSTVTAPLATTEQVTADPQTPAPTTLLGMTELYPSYEPGDLHYETDRITVDITQWYEKDMVYYVCDIRLTEPTQLSYAFSGEAWREPREAVSDIADRHRPVVAINGDFYSFHNNGIILRGGVLYRAQSSDRHLLIIDKNGDLSAVTDRSGKQSAVADRLIEENALHTYEFGPLLVENGDAVPLPGNYKLVSTGEYYEPRTAIGQYGPLHYLVIVVDGRRPGYSQGATLPELQALFIKHGAEFAYNLDGGGSTTLYFNGEVVNLPSAGDERSVSDIVMFMP